ncbi:MAG: segregation/condensation protein A [Deltaproteobacteria bacterium]|nr:segregation/condensation protein A [Deltaproteobacteria bacterium]
MDYKVKIDIFEGPLDLLLHLAKKNRVDIYDIPIAVITEQYLDYIDMIKSMNLELAGEFLLMASNLVYIKSKMLLPVDAAAPEEEDDGVDPRAELIKKLLEYQRFKAAAIELASRDLLGRDVFTRGAPFPIGDLEESEEDVSAFLDINLFDLMAAFRDILNKTPSIHKVDITVDRFKVKDKINHILDTLGEGKSIAFNELFKDDSSKGEVIVTFLAILELAKLLMLKVYQAEAGQSQGIRVFRSGVVAPSGEGFTQGSIDDYEGSAQ